MSYTREQWARGFLAALGNPNPNQGIVDYVVSWTRFETSSGEGATYNLLNTTQREPGSSDFNSVGVQNFVSFDQGVQANAAVLRLPYYPVLCNALTQNVLQLLTAGWSEQETINRELDTWGTGPKSLLFLESLGQGLEDEFEGTATVPSGGKTYVVQGGDTLNEIAKTVGEDEKALYSANATAIEAAAHAHSYPSSNSGNLIFPGTVLVLSTPAKATTYTVVSGDTLTKIAEKVGEAETVLFEKNKATLDAIAREHGYPDSHNGDLIFPGSVLEI